MPSNEVLVGHKCLYSHINGRSPKLRVKLSSTPRQDVAVSTITKAEMFYSSAKSQTPQRSREIQIEFLETLISLSFDRITGLKIEDWET